MTKTEWDASEFSSEIRKDIPKKDNLNFFLYFRFWGTCPGHAGLLYRYIHGNMAFCLPSPVTYIWHFSPCYPSPTPAIPPIAPNRPQCFDKCLHISFFFNFLLDFRFWGTWAEHARQLRRYAHGSVLCFPFPLHPHSVFLPRLSLPFSPQ